MSVWGVFKERGLTSKQLTSFLPTIFFCSNKMWHAIKTFLLKKYQKTQTQLLLENCKTKERKEINYKYVYYHFSCSCWIHNNLTNDTSTESRYTFLKFSMAHVLWMPHKFFLNNTAQKIRTNKTWTCLRGGSYLSCGR